jgi:hypothetical protein
MASLSLVYLTSQDNLCLMYFLHHHLSHTVSMFERKCLLTVIYNKEMNFSSEIGINRAWTVYHGYTMLNG